MLLKLNITLKFIKMRFHCNICYRKQ